MKCRRLLSLLAPVLAIVTVLGAAPVHALGGSLPDFTALVQANGPAVVNISTTAPQEEATADDETKVLRGSAQSANRPDPGESVSRSGP